MHTCLGLCSNFSFFEHLGLSLAILSLVMVGLPGSFNLPRALVTKGWWGSCLTTLFLDPMHVHVLHLVEPCWTWDPHANVHRPLSAHVHWFPRGDDLILMGHDGFFPGSTGLIIWPSSEKRPKIGSINTPVLAHPSHSCSCTQLILVAL